MTSFLNVLASGLHLLGVTYPSIFYLQYRNRYNSIYSTACTMSKAQLRLQFAKQYLAHMFLEIIYHNLCTKKRTSIIASLQNETNEQYIGPIIVCVLTLFTESITVIKEVILICFCLKKPALSF